uniref:VWA domain-containing protein n=1 Tax=candidate division WOR-3 bacterium TaxID=2052148 RepID=A0A7C4G9E3_UNCW3
MGFAAPGLLPLAALAAIPVVIHLLSRLRLQRQNFPALMLLQSVRRERFSWLRLKEIILLLLRTLLLATLLLSLSRPYLRPRTQPGPAGDVVLVLDDSYSMGYGSRWQKAIDNCSQLLRSLGPGRRAALLTTSGTDPFPELAADPRPRLALLDTLRPSFSAAGLGPALDRAVKLAAPSRAEVWVFSDLQAGSLPADWHAPAGLKPVFVDCGSEQFDNSGVTEVRLEERRIVARLANYGSRPVTRTATLSLEERREEKVVSIPARGTADVVFDTPLPRSGTVTGSVDMLTDSLPADDRRWFAFTVPDEIRVLVLQSAAAPADYILDALAAGQSAPLRVTVADITETGRLDLRDYSVIVVSDAGRLDPAGRSRLNFALGSGRALLLMFADGTSPDAAMETYFRIAGEVRPAGFVTIAAADTSHPLLARLARAELASARFFVHAKLEPRAATVLARFSDSDPFILEAAEGRLQVWTAAPLPALTDLVFRAAFAPLLVRSVNYLAAVGSRADYPVGETIRIPAPRAGPVTVSTPAGNLALTAEASTARPSVTLSDTRIPGIYRLAEGPAVAVNPVPAEGDLRRMTAAECSAREIEVRDNVGRPAVDLVLPLLLAAAVALAAEMLLLAL